MMRHSADGAHEEILNHRRQSSRSSIRSPVQFDPLRSAAPRFGGARIGSQPVAVLINKALIEIPPTFASRPPVFLGAADARLGDWPRATGLAEDVRRYGAWMRDPGLLNDVGTLYPDATIIDDKTGKESSATTIAWIWARTVTCPNPACGIEAPLVRSWWRWGRRRERSLHRPESGRGSRNAQRAKSRIHNQQRQGKSSLRSRGTAQCQGRQGGHCLACGATISAAQAHSEVDVPHDLQPPAAMMAIVAAGNRRRVYLSPNPKHISAEITVRSKRLRFGVQSGHSPPSHEALWWQCTGSQVGLRHILVTTYRSAVGGTDDVQLTPWTRCGKRL